MQPQIATANNKSRYAATLFIPSLSPGDVTLRTLREPPLFHALALMKDLADTPQRRCPHNRQHKRAEEIRDKKRGYDGSNTDNKKRPPAFDAEIVFAFDDKRVKKPYCKECGCSHNESAKVQIIHIYKCKQQRKDSVFFVTAVGNEKLGIDETHVIASEYRGSKRYERGNLPLFIAYK